MKTYAILAAIAAAYLFASSGDYQDAVEMEARLAALPPPAFRVSTDPVADVGQDFGPCLTDEECEAIEAAWEAVHAAER